MLWIKGNRRGTFHSAQHRMSNLMKLCLRTKSATFDRQKFSLNFFMRILVSLPSSSLLLFFCVVSGSSHLRPPIWPLVQFLCFISVFLSHPKYFILQWSHILDALQLIHSPSQYIFIVCIISIKHYQIIEDWTSLVSVPGLAQSLLVGDRQGDSYSQYGVRSLWAPRGQELCLMSQTSHATPSKPVLPT